MHAHHTMIWNGCPSFHALNAIQHEGKIIILKTVNKVFSPHAILQRLQHPVANAVEMIADQEIGSSFIKIKAHA